MMRATGLWPLTSGQRGRYAAAIAALGLNILCLFAVPLLVRAGLDRLVEDGTLPWLPALGVLGLSGLAAVFAYFHARWAAAASEGLARRLREHLYQHLQALPCRFHAFAETGDLVQRCTSDVETVRVFLAKQIVEIGRAALFLVFVTPLLFWLDTSLAWASLVLFPVIITFAAMFFSRVKARFQAADEAEGALTSVLQENLRGLRVVRAFAREEHEGARFADKNARFRDASNQMWNLLAVYWSVSDLLCLIQMGLPLAVGASRLASGAISVGDLFAALGFVALVIFPVRHLGRVLADAGQATVALERLREILGEPVEDEAPGEPAARLRGAIAIEDLAFAWQEGEPVLRGLSLRIEPGETVALFGPPGAGKSTIVQLLLRLVDYDSGSIRLDGQELRELPRRWVRERVGVVLQEPFLFSRTLAENLRFGAPDAGQPRLEEAAKAARLHGNIVGFPDGYETLVGERGVTLSGGQRQRLAIARAMLKDPELLVLDDALSAVDTETEAAILAALDARRGRRTTVLIAHRLSTVAHADRIFVLEEGRVRQAGSHQALLAEDGPYRELWNLQSTRDETLARELTAPSGARETS